MEISVDLQDGVQTLEIARLQVHERIPIVTGVLCNRALGPVA